MFQKEVERQISTTDIHIVRMIHGKPPQRNRETCCFKVQIKDRYTGRATQKTATQKTHNMQTHRELERLALPGADRKVKKRS